MTTSVTSGVRRWAAVARAEFLKIWASKIPLVIFLALPAGTYLFVLELYHVERIGARRAIGNAVEALPLVFFATWNTLLFQLAMVMFAAFWATVDSQYGMIRVACSQPLTRTELLLGRWCAVSAHVVIVTAGLVASELAWTVVYSGVRGVRPADALIVARFTLDVAVLLVSVCVVAMAAASFRRTVGSGIVTALMAFILLAMMTMIPFEILPPRFVLLRYFFYPLQDLPAPAWPGADSPFQRPDFLTSFYTVALVTPVVFALPAILRFRRRDIVE